MRIIKNEIISSETIQHFIDQIDFELPVDFLDFYKESNGAEIYTDTGEFIIVWKLNDLLRLNIEYNVDEYAPGFFIFGSDGGNEAYCIQKITGNIYQIPFVGMSTEDALFVCKTLSELFKE